MFKFRFPDPAAEQHAGVVVAQPDKEDASGTGADAVGAEEVPASEGKPTGSQETVAITPQLTLFKGVIINAQAATLLSDDRVESNDLIAGVYEGGFKSWEGGVDLAQFLAAALHRQEEQAEEQQHEQQQPEEEQWEQQSAAPPALMLRAESRVMELGCGHGLPGLVALWAGAEVHFQDYNRSVLSLLTIPNAETNASAWATRRGAASAAPSSPAAAAAPRARYFAGSWAALPKELERLGLEHSYDLVLTAETIYSLEAMRSLYRCIKACLRPGSGAAYVAAKSYYFGVGGSTAAFQQLVEADSTFGCRTVAVVDDGLSNKREILQLAPAWRQ